MSWNNNIIIPESRIKGTSKTSFHILFKGQLLILHIPKKCVENAGDGFAKVRLNEEWDYNSVENPKMSVKGKDIIEMGQYD